MTFPTSIAAAITFVGSLMLNQTAEPNAVAPEASAEAAPSADQAAVDEAVAGVEAFYSGVTDFKATFAQEVRRKHLPRPLRKKGTVFFKKPGMMRWDYTQPEKVYYISDGEILWSYQPEDKLVYKVPVKDSELYGALKFLFGQGDLRKEFNVALGEAAEGQVALLLTPKVKQSNYKSLTLHVKRGTWEIAQTELVDPLDNVSRVTFSDASYDTLKDEGFRFTPPKGVRVEDLRNR